MYSLYGVTVALLWLIIMRPCLADLDSDLTTCACRQYQEYSGEKIARSDLSTLYSLKVSMPQGCFPVVLKDVLTDASNDVNREHRVQEARNEEFWLERLKGHQHIVYLYGTEKTVEHFYLVMPHYFSDLYLLLKALHAKEKDMTVPELIRKPQLGPLLSHYDSQLCPLVTGLVKGLMAVHEQGGVHSDLTPWNIMMERTAEGYFQLRLGDFGGTQQAGVVTGHLTGIFTFFPPEIFDQTGMKPALPCVIYQSVDLWQLGIVIAMLAGKTFYPVFTEQTGKNFQGKKERLNYRDFADGLLCDVENELNDLAEIVDQQSFDKLPHYLATCKPDCTSREVLLMAAWYLLGEARNRPRAKDILTFLQTVTCKS
ncbi:protein kinase domain-containing protein [Spongorhabdus nitratireducens]